MNKKIYKLVVFLTIITLLTGCGRIKSEIKDELDYNETTQTENNFQTNVEKIAQTDAEAIALKHAGLSTDEITRLRTEYDYDNGRYEYDIEFYANGIEYNYTIDAFSGEILQFEKDTD